MFPPPPLDPCECQKHVGLPSICFARHNMKESKDALRDGLSSFKEETSSRHPVEDLAVQAPKREQVTRQRMLGNLYGTAFPARMQIEAQILNRVERLPGIPSSKLGLEALSGSLDEVNFETYLGLERETETAPADLHSQIEARISGHA